MRRDEGELGRRLAMLRRRGCDRSELPLGAHLHLFPQITNLLRDREARDILVFGGGAIPDEDIPNLPASGIQAIFTPGTSAREAITGV